MIQHHKSAPSTLARVFANFSRAVIAVILAACADPLEARQSAAVNPQAYANSLEAYVTGRELVETVNTLQLWNRKDFEAAVDRLILARNLQQMEAAAIFQLEIGLGAISASPEGAQIHFELGEKLLRSLAPTPAELRLNPGRAEDVRAFSTTWFGVAGSGYLWITDTKRAWTWIEKALRLSPQSAAIRLLDGAAFEIEASGHDPRVPRSGPGSPGAYFERRRKLGLAHSAFRAAVASAPENSYAHIRLGRTSFLLDRIEEARESLERGLALATKKDDIYLGSLFLGAIQERQNDFTGARASYDRAMASLPWSQTGIIALAHLELIAGRPDRAQALARAFTEAPVDDHVWWAYKNGGLDHDGLASLRARVQQ